MTRSLLAGSQESGLAVNRRAATAPARLAAAVMGVANPPRGGVRIPKVTLTVAYLVRTAIRRTL
jgi:hypothetical protein